MLTLDKQRVRVFVLSNMDVFLLGYDDRNCTLTTLQCDDGSRLRIDIDFGEIYEMLIC